MKIAKIILLIAILAYIAYATVICVNNTQPAKKHDHSEDDQPAAQNSVAEISQLEKMLVAEPKNLRIHLRLGHLYLETKQPGKAAELFEKTLSFAADNAEVQVDLGIAYHQNGQIKKAEQILLNATQTFPTYPDGWLQLGVVYMYSLKDTRKALNAWKKFLKLEPDGAYSSEIRKQIKVLEQALEK